MASKPVEPTLLGNKKLTAEAKNMSPPTTVRALKTGAVGLVVLLFTKSNS
jgi:hypothetical protein